MKFILKICTDASVLLQGQTETLPEALKCIQTMRTFLDRPIPPNVDPIWDEIWEEAQRIVSECDLPALPHRPIRRARSDHADHAGNYLSKDDYLKRVFLPVCQRVGDELDKRFLNEENQVVYSGVVSLTPGSESFGDLISITKYCKHYGIIGEDSRPLLSEIALLADMFRRGGEDLPTDLLGLYNFLLHHSRVFFRIHQAIKISITLPVTSGSSERSFSALRRIKTYLRQTMSDQQTTDLDVLTINREELHKIKTEAVIDRFMEKNRRIVLV